MSSPEALLLTTGLSRAFGGLVAVDSVSLQLDPATIHAVIGPNGAGKSTLVNLLAGEVKPSSGSIRLRGEDITGWKPDRIARRGVARTFQHTNVFPDFTVFENCRLAAQSRNVHLMRWLKPAESYREWNDAARSAMAMADLGARAGVPAHSLSHGERRALEIAMSLATAPAVLLLDEPLAGMGAEESIRIVALLKRLSADHSILLFEHDIELGLHHLVGQHEVGHAIGFHFHHQLEMVAGDSLEITGVVAGGERILRAANGPDRLRELPLRILCGPFEQKMFEEMGEARFARRLIRRPDAVPQHVGDDGRTVIGDDHNLKTIGERKMSNIRTAH